MNGLLLLLDQGFWVLSDMYSLKGTSKSIFSKFSVGLCKLCLSKPKFVQEVLEIFGHIIKFGGKFEYFNWYGKPFLFGVSKNVWQNVTHF